MVAPKPAAISELFVPPCEAIGTAAGAGPKDIFTYQIIIPLNTAKQPINKNKLVELFAGKLLGPEGDVGCISSINLIVPEVDLAPCA